MIAQVFDEAFEKVKNLVAIFKVNIESILVSTVLSTGGGQPAIGQQ
ncbi:MAG: hypothetical protein V1899_01955 [Planctomycetota bacterium]